MQSCKLRVEGSGELRVQGTDLVPKVIAEPARIEPSTILLAPSVAAVPGTDKNISIGLEIKSRPHLLNSLSNLSDLLYCLWFRVPKIAPSVAAVPGAVFSVNAIIFEGFQGPVFRCRVNAAHVRQSRTDFSLGLSHFSGKRRETLAGCPPSLNKGGCLLQNAFI